MIARKARRKIAFFVVSPEDHDDLKVISEAREKLDKCVVPSMPCSPKEGCSGKLAVLPMFCCLGRLEATLISNSSGQEGQKHQTTWITSPKNDMCWNSTTAWRTLPSPSRKRRRIPEAKAAVDKAGDRLESYQRGASRV